MKRWTRLSALGALALAGCATVPRESGFTAVQATVAERTGQRIHWNQGTAEDQQAARAVTDLLARELTADDAVQVALLNNPSLQATYEDLGIAQAELVEAGLLRNPTLAAEVRFPKYHALPFDIDVAQSFLDLLTAPLRKRAAGAAFEAARQRVTHEVLNAAAETKAAFYRAQGEAQKVDLRRTILASTDASLDAARRLREAGNVTDLAVANQQALYEQAAVDLAKAERDARDAREELSATMGLSGPDADRWTIAAKLPAPPTAEASLAGLEAMAISRRADLAAARQDVQAVAGNLGLAKYAAWGDVSVGGHVEKETDGALSIGPTVEVPLPIFNQGQPAVAAAQSRLRQSQRRYDALAVQVRAQVRRAQNKLTSARDLVERYARVIVPLKHRIVQQDLLQLNAMQIGIFELLTAEQAEIDAGRDYVEALEDYWLARAELERAVGGRLPGDAAITPATQPASTQPAEPHPHHHGE